MYVRSSKLPTNENNASNLDVFELIKIFIEPYFMPPSNVSIVDIEQVSFCWIPSIGPDPAAEMNKMKDQL